jgi:methionine synthase I (cobalamin-dependent)
MPTVRWNALLNAVSEEDPTACAIAATDVSPSRRERSAERMRRTRTTRSRWAATTPLCALLPSISLIGGCCGTDHRQVSAILGAW